MENIQNVGFKQNHLIFFVLLIKYFVHVLLMISSAFNKTWQQPAQETKNKRLHFHFKTMD